MKHLKLFFALFAMLALGVGNAWAETATVDFSTLYNADTDVSSTTFSVVEGISLVFNKETGSTAPKYYKSGTAVRLYAKGTMTVSSTIGKITKITLTYGSSDKTNTISVNCGSFSTSNWTGEADQVVFTIDGTSGHRRIKAVEVTYTSSAGGDDSGSTTPVALSAPTNLQATNIAETSATLSWNTVANATGYSVTINGSTQDVTTTSYEATSLTAETAYNWSVLAKGDGTNFTNSTVATATFTTLAAQTGGEEGGSNKVTYDFTKIEDFSSWNSSYSKREVTYSDAKVTFASACRQTGTITNQPVTKGQEVSLVMTDGSNLSTVEWKCTQWTTKTQTITLHYSTNGGNTWTKTNITSTNFTISSDNLPEGTDAVKITFSSTSNQIGITSCTITKVAAAAETAAAEPIFSLPEGTYETEQTLTLTCPTADAVIYYSTDGATFNVYSTPITLNQTTTVKAYATKAGLDNSQTLEYTYIFTAPADVILDFTTNNWGLPSGSTNKVTTEASYTDGTYTVSVAGTNGHYFDTNNLITGKQNAYIILPTFDRPIVKVVCEGVSTGSGSVQFNLFIEDEAVSTAVTSCKVDQTFLIAEDEQAANVAHIIKVTNAYNLRISKIRIYLGEAPAVEKPEISGVEDFINSTEVTITCPTSGATIYYTTNGDAPTNTSTPYFAPFSINATTTVKAIAYDANGNASKVAEMTFTKHELVNVATAMALEKDKIAYFDEFEVVKKVEGKGYIYIKDASGHGLIFDYDLESALKDGDRVKGFVGISSPYNNLPEMKPYNVTATDLTITSGTAAEPYDFSSTAIAAEHMNKYVVFKGVEMTENVDITSHPTLTIGGNSVYLRNQFGKSVTLTSGVKYDIYAFVAIYNTTLQYYFYQANEEGEASVKYTVTYNAGGATGTVPVDNNQYAAGDQVYLESALSLSYEGYEYKGWKVTDVNGNEIPVSNNRFNMPASNVTVTAQWEQIKERLDFSTGLWVLVTDASELVEGDKIIFTAAEANVAMMSYESGNNIKKCDVAKFGKDNCFLTWKSEIGVYQLVASGDKYAIQDVNTEQYIYAAGTGSSNYLKATDEVPATGMEPYRWNITIDENGTTVQATSENRNLLAYNKTNAIFSCYAASSNQQPIAIYKYVSDPNKYYTRDGINAGGAEYGTLCLPYASSKYAGAEFYKIAGKETGKVTLVAEEGNLEAGVPYIFFVKGSQLVVAYEGTAVGSAANENGLYGTFTDNTPVASGNYIISKGKVLAPCGTGCYVNANRAYVVMDEVSSGVNKLPGRKYITMDVQEENEATGFDQIVAPEGQTIKAIVNGQLIIIRDGVKYNVQGQKL